MIKLITSNTKDDLISLLHNVKESFYMICPFIGYNTSNELANIIKKNKIKATIITRFSRDDFYNKVSSLEGLRILNDVGCELKAVQRLHTKLYIFDSNAMILGSSNFTDGGLMTNVELNVLIKDEKTIINHGITYFDEIDVSIGEEHCITKEMIIEELGYLNSIKRNKELKFSRSYDRGKKLIHKKKQDKIEELLSPKNLKKNSELTAWIKFEGYSDSRRAKNDTLLNIDLDKDNRYRTHFPKKPSGYKNGDLIFIARNSWDKNGDKSPIIYGYGIASKFNNKNVMSKKQQEKNEKFKRWPYYIFVEKFRFITSRLIDGISLLELYRKIGYDTYPGSQKRKSSFVKN